MSYFFSLRHIVTCVQKLAILFELPLHSPNSFTEGMWKNGKTALKHIASVNLLKSLVVIRKTYNLKQSMFLYNVLPNLKNKMGSEFAMFKGKNEMNLQTVKTPWCSLLQRPSLQLPSHVANWFHGTTQPALFTSLSFHHFLVSPYPVQPGQGCLWGNSITHFLCFFLYLKKEESIRILFLILPV